MKRSGLAALGATALGLVGHALVARYFNEQTWARHQQNYDLLMWIQQTIQGEWPPEFSRWLHEQETAALAERLDTPGGTT